MSRDSRGWNNDDRRDPERDGHQRSWGGLGYIGAGELQEVPRNLLTGKAFFVYWPHGKPFGPDIRLNPDLRVPFRPYVERMKWIPLIAGSESNGPHGSSRRIGSMALLEVRSLEKVYGRRKVVNGVTFDVSQGEVVGLLGPNGAGKTTSFRMTIGLINADGGKVTFDGREVTNMPMYQRARLGMGYLAQDSSVFKQLTVEDNLMAILQTLPKLNRRQRIDRQNELLDQFGLVHIRRTKANRVSGGERRRLEIARSLITDPKLIMLDEPFAGIDPKTVNEIQDSIRELAVRFNLGHSPDRPQLPRDDRGHRPQIT